MVSSEDRDRFGSITMQQSTSANGFSKMKALWLDNSRLVLRDDLPMPKSGPEEALVAVRLAGICGTDLALANGYYPFRGIPGHEFVGKIVQAAAAPERVGQRVVGEINIGCGRCRACLAGRERHCENRNVLGIRGRHGAFAEFLALPLKNLAPVPLAVDDEAAVFVEPLAAALQIQSQLTISSDERVLVIGAGRLGQLIARSLQATGCRLQVVARHLTQRRLLERSGIGCLGESEVPAGAYDVVIEAGGDPGCWKLARQAVRAQGVIVLKSTYRGSVRVDASALVADEITVIGSRCGPFAPAVKRLAEGQIDPRPLIEARYPLAEGPAAFAHAARPGVLKVLLRVTS